MRNMMTGFVLIAKPSKQSTTRLYFGDMLKFIKELLSSSKKRKS